MRPRKILLWPLFLVLIGNLAYSYVFDSIDVSSKARGMGGAWTASADDATAIFYNPACLVDVSSPNVCATLLQPNSQDFEMLGFAAFSMPVGSAHHTAVSFRGFGVEYEDVDLLDERTLSFAYATSLMKDIHSSLYMGGGLNIYWLDFGSTATADLGSDATYGIDLGLLGILRDRTRIGFLVKNINEPSLGKTNKEPLPQWISAGVSYAPYYGVVTELDIRSLRGQDVELHMGMEFAVTEFLEMRFGFQTEPNSLTGGFSAMVSTVSLDYSYSSHSVLPGTHHVALRAAF